MKYILQNFLHLIMRFLYNISRGGKNVVLRLINVTRPKSAMNVRGFRVMFARFIRGPPSGNKFQGWSETVTLHVLLTNSRGSSLPSFFRLATLAHFALAFRSAHFGVLLQTPEALEPSSRVIRYLFAYLHLPFGSG